LPTLPLIWIAAQLSITDCDCDPDPDADPRWFLCAMDARGAWEAVPKITRNYDPIGIGIGIGRCEGCPQTGSG
jgi:hypothetical protein